MAIPDFQSVMLPVMNCLTSSEVVSNADVINQISNEFELTLEQRAEVLLSSKQIILFQRLRVSLYE